MKSRYKIGCVVVTFNRKELLVRCLDAIKNQSYKPDTVYIIDNASIDGTCEYIASAGYYNKTVDGVCFRYYCCEKNIGGSGGFYTGMKMANETGAFDGIWVMDDDGEPEQDCLKELVRFLNNRDYIAPVVLSDEDHDTCSFVPNTTYCEFCKSAGDDGVVEGWASPFNGILYSSRLVKKIGYPKKEMFIWGDEINYQLRAEKAGFHRMTAIKAIHFHPLDRQKSICDDSTLNITLTPIDIDWKLYCVIRNRIYNLHLMYGWYVVFKKSLELYKAYKHYFRSQKIYTKDRIILEATLSGYCGYFGGLKKYFNC